MTLGRWSKSLRWVLAPALLVAMQAAMGAGFAQSEPESQVTLYASGLYNPRGMTWNAEGVLYVSQAGTGDTTTSVGEASGVVRIVAGCPQPFASGFPSTGTLADGFQGPTALTFFDDTLYVVQDSIQDATQLLDTFPNGVYSVDEGGAPKLVADLSKWMTENPTKDVPGDHGPLGEPYQIMNGDGFLWVLEANEGQMLKVTPAGEISRFVDLSEGHPVWTAMALAPDGGVYMGNLSQDPYPDSEARVVKVDADGTVTTVWTGLTMITAMVAASDGALYVAEMSTTNSGVGYQIVPNSGRIVKQDGPESSVTVVSGLDFPVGMSIGPDGALYVSGPALGSAGPAGTILRVDAAAENLVVPEDIYANSTCTGFLDARAALYPEEADEIATEQVPTAAPTTIPTAAAATAAAEPTAAVKTTQVTIKNFAFDPPTVTLDKGQAIEWTNKDAIPHTATATNDDPFNSGNLNQNQQFTFTFQADGTIAYTCIYHPYMKGTIVVNP